MTRQTMFVPVGLFAAAVVCSVLTPGAAAQNLSKFVISPEAAKKALTKEEISLDTADKIVQVCIDYARQRKLNLAITILAPNGSIVTSKRMDGQGAGNIEMALRRAQTVIFWHATFRSTRDIFNQGEGVGDLASQVRFYTTSPGYPAPGGMSIIVDDTFIGAIGVGGSGPEDENCAYAGLTAVLGPQPPMSKKLPNPTEFRPRPRGEPARPAQPAQ